MESGRCGEEKEVTLPSMLTLILVFSATFFEEVSSVFTKKGISDRQESIYTAGFLNLFFVTLFFLAIILYGGNFIFSLQSLPVFGLRILLEFVILTIGLRAVALADRTTFSFIHSGTIPLLLAIDIVLGYAISPAQLAGILLFCGIILILAFSKGIEKRGALNVALLTLGAAATISLFKYDITHYNSLEAGQFMANAILLVYLFFYNLFVRKENSFRAFRMIGFFTQSFTAGLAAVVVSFAYLYGAASIITALKRIGEVSWSLLSGRIYFHEKHILIKLFLVLMLGVSIVLILP
ncbi:MAG: hypothetical protein UY44_C0002G0007 [Candidatus Kaiserbacteria bacterium GW2011_GWA2_49_19]|uniref:EamA domain-containing protein n=2 Tax=Candidatus Kaiseribacteriota TaxID=1752734 RepID=A0A0G1Y393_9BACT|nr:MAG: hypothetical protein UY44_C0002G0007 [Candidatus Kaiserbacteria bacterium GW2011_GWA2_49_19]